MWCFIHSALIFHLVIPLSMQANIAFRAASINSAGTGSLTIVAPNAIVTDDVYSPWAYELLFFATSALLGHSDQMSYASHWGKMSAAEAAPAMQDGLRTPGHRGQHGHVALMRCTAFSKFCAIQKARHCWLCSWPPFLPVLLSLQLFTPGRPAGLITPCQPMQLLARWPSPNRLIQWRGRHWSLQLRHDRITWQ